MMPFWSLSTGGSHETSTVLELTILAFKFVGSPGTKKWNNKLVLSVYQNVLLNRSHKKLNQRKKRVVKQDQNKKFTTFLFFFQKFGAIMCGTTINNIEIGEVCVWKYKWCQ